MKSQNSFTVNLVGLDDFPHGRAVVMPTEVAKKASKPVKTVWLTCMTKGKWASCPKLAQLAIFSAGLPLKRVAGQSESDEE